MKMGFLLTKTTSICIFGHHRHPQEIAIFITKNVFDEATGRANYTDPNKLSPWSFYTKPGNSIFYIESVSDDILVLHNIYAWETDEYYENRSLRPEQSYYRAYYRALPEAEADKWLSQYSKWPEN